MENAQGMLRKLAANTVYFDLQIIDSLIKVNLDSS
jgi:hypothetical protein